MDSTFRLSQYQKTLELDKGSRRLVRQDKPLWALSKSIYEHFPTNSDEKLAQVQASLKRRRLNRKHRRSRCLLSREVNWNPPINFAVENTNIVRPKFNFIQRINRQENLAILGNSWGNNWAKKSGQDTRHGPHATWEVPRMGPESRSCTFPLGRRVYRKAGK